MRLLRLSLSFYFLLSVVSIVVSVVSFSSIVHVAVVSSVRLSCSCLNLLSFSSESYG